MIDSFQLFEGGEEGIKIKVMYIDGDTVKDQNFELFLNFVDVNVSSR